MAKPNKRAAKKEASPKVKEGSHYDRAPGQKNSDRNPVRSAEETRDIPTQHGAIK